MSELPVTPLETLRAPHFPDPDANAVALLEAHNAELVEALADAHKEAKAWQAQLEAALERLKIAEALAIDLIKVLATDLIKANGRTPEQIVEQLYVNA